MKNEESERLIECVHSMRNSLNGVALNAELGKMLLDEDASVDDLRSAFSSILLACRECDQTLAEARSLAAK